MSLLAEANERYRTTFKYGMSGWDVIACQVALNSHYPSPNLVLDGSFGRATEHAAKQLQEALHIEVDGVVGPITQQRFMAVKCNRPKNVPAGLVHGIAEGESSSMWAATSARYGDGSRDYGPLQDHQLNPSETTLEACFNPEVEAYKVAGIVANSHRGLRERHPAMSEELAWKLALFSYNWPRGAELIANGEAQGPGTYIESGTLIRRKMSNTAPWIEAIGVSWEGKPVRTGVDWMNFYVGTKDQYITSWTTT